MRPWKGLCEAAPPAVTVRHLPRREEESRLDSRSYRWWRRGWGVAAALALAAAAGGVRAELDATEHAIVAFVDAERAALEADLERHVNVNSGTMNPDGVRAVGALLERELEALGFATEWIDLAHVNRGGHLFARREGDRGKRVLLIGHLDTVFERDDAFQTFVRDGAWARGPGVADMKSGNLVIVYALKALAAAGALDGAQIVVAYTGEEENPGEPLAESRAHLVEAGRFADVALEFEAGTRDASGELIVTGRRSSSEWRLEVAGRQAHSSRIFSAEVGAGAIFEAARILAAFYEELAEEPYLAFNAGTILGGTDVEYDAAETRGRAFGKTNVVPRRAVVHGGIRTISSEQLERVRERMRAIVARSLPHTEASIAFADAYPPMAPTEGNRALLEMLSAINEELGGGALRAVDPALRGASDISFVAPYTDGLAGLGPYGEGGHTPDERVDLESIPRAVQRAAILIYRLTR